MGEPTLRPCRFPYAFPDAPVRLAKRVHSLVRFSKRTTTRRLPTGPTSSSHSIRSLPGLVRIVALSPLDFRPYCTSLLGVLFSVRSRYLFAIGLETYLVFPVDAWDIHEGYPTPATLELAHAVLAYVTGLSPCFTPHSRGLHVDDPTMRASPNTTLPEGFGLDWAAFTRRYLRHLLAISLPAGTKMFQFPAFPIAQSNCDEDSY